MANGIDPAVLELIKQQRLGTAQATVPAVVPPTNTPVPAALAPSVVPQGFFAADQPADTLAPTPTKGIFADPSTILGFAPEKFATFAGGLAAALAPPNTWQSRLGKLAVGMAKGKTFGKGIGADVQGAKLKKKEEPEPEKSSPKSRLTSSALANQPLI